MKLEKNQEETNLEVEKVEKPKRKRTPKKKKEEIVQEVVDNNPKGKIVEFVIADVYKEVFTTDKHFIILGSGRSGGKTSFLGQLIMIYANKYPQRDMVICRDAFSSLRGSFYSELQSWIAECGLEKDFELKLQPLSMYNKRNDVTIYFKGVGGPDRSVTKGFKPKHKLSLILFEETQQLKDQEMLEQAHSTFIRNLDEDVGKVVHLFNPEPQNAHWLNVYFKMKQLDDDWLCIKSSFLDVAHFINNVELKRILKMAVTDKNRFNYLYLGLTGGGFGSVYPQFKPEKHVLRYNEVQKRWNNDIVALIIGVDSAVTHDATCCSPLAIMKNGQAVVLNLFYHDPLKSRVLASSEQVDLMRNWFAELYKAYRIQERHVPVVWVVDSAAADMKVQLRYSFDKPNIAMSVVSYQKQKIPEMVSVVQNVFAKNMCYICDFGGYKNYYENKFFYGENVLAFQLESLVWNDNFTGYKDSIPNDASDSLTYAVNYYFRNPDNLHWLDAIKLSSQSYYEDENN